MASGPCCLDIPQSGNADYVIGHIQIDVFAETNLIGVGVVVGIAAPGQQAAFDTFASIGIAGADAEWLACFLYNVPQLRAFGAIHQIKFDPTLF